MPTNPVPSLGSEAFATHPPSGAIAGPRPIRRKEVFSDKRLAMIRRTGCILLLATALTAPDGARGQASAFSHDWLALRGTIDRYPVTFFLDRSGDDVTGHYWYDRTGEPITVYGTLARGVLRLDGSARDDDATAETFRLRPEGRGWSGTWSQAASPRSLTVALLPRTDAPAMRMLHYADSFPALKTRGGPMARFNVVLAWPAGEGPREVFLRQQVLAGLGPAGAAPADPLATVRAVRTAYFRMYAGEMKDVGPEEVSEMPEAYNWSRDERISIASLAGDIACLEQFRYEYSGGAHGLAASSFRVLDLRNRRVLTQEDVFTPAGLRALPGLLERHYRRTRKVGPGTSLEDAGLLVDRIESERYNFFLTGPAVVFSFAPYEIAAYAYGEIRIPVPLTDLKPHLRPGFAALLVPAVR